MLKKRVLLSLVLAAFASARAPLAAGQDAAWSRYTYPGEEFSVELPSMPGVVHTSRVIRYRPYDSDEMRVFNLYSGGVIYFVVAYDKPRASESLDHFAVYLYGSWGLVPKEALTLAGFEGRAYDVVGVQRGPNFYGVHGEARVFRTKRHAYLALAVTTEPGRPEVARFLNGFAPATNPSGEMIAEDAPVPRYAPPKKQAVTATGTEERQKLAPHERAPGGPLTMKEVERKALIVYKPEPGFTEEARKNNVTGVVRLRAVLNATGQVTDAEVLKPLSKGLTENALRASRHMRFFPAQKGGRPVSQYIVLEYNFNIY
jgi:TonB family protein